MNNIQTQEKQKTSIAGILFLIMALLVINSLGIKSKEDGTILTVLYIALASFLFLIGSVYSFVFSFVVHVDIMTCLNFSSIKLISLFCMYFIFLLNANVLMWVLENKKIKTVFILGLIFSIYAFLNIGLKESFALDNIIPNAGYIFGFLSVVPAYYYAYKNTNQLFLSLLVVAFLFIGIYYINLAYDLNLLRISEMERNQFSSMKRYAGYDVRQFVIFFSYLIPAILISQKIRTSKKAILFIIGIGAYSILVVAIYRLAMFYVASGSILALVLISQYIKVTRKLKIITGLFSCVFLLLLIFQQYVVELSHVITWTLTASNNLEDASANVRLMIQLPMLLDLFIDNLWTGAGLAKLLMLQKTNFYGFVDIPFVGTLSAFGILGMSIYYMKYYVLFSKSNLGINSKVRENQESTFLLSFYLTLKAYFITMITFRMFYISWELTFDYQQAEFGLFVGVFFALQKILLKIPQI